MLFLTAEREQQKTDGGQRSNRMLEQAFAPDDQYTVMMGAFHPTFSDLQGIFRDELQKQQALIKKNMLNPGLDNMTRIHLREMNDKITRKFAIK